MLFTHKHLNYIAASNMKDPEAYLKEVNYGTIYKELWDEADVAEQDKRTGAEIINDTLKDFNIQIKEGAESQ